MKTAYCRMIQSMPASCGIALMTLILHGCVVTYPVVATFDNHNEVVYGTVTSNLAVGQSEIEVAGRVTGLKCRGNSHVTYIPPIAYVVPTCAGQRGAVLLQCDDGRVVNGEWQSTSCKTGYGRGADQNGAAFTFTFGMEEKEALAYMEQQLKVAAQRPDLPVYRPKEVRKEKGFSTGSGFFVTRNGVLITNFHVIEDAKHVVVVVPGANKEQDARVLLVDRANDVAILKVDVDTEPIPIGSTDELARGQEVFTLGYPLVSIQGQEQKATFGRINALTGLKDDARLVQIDVPIQPGNSGSPLLNKRGEVVGVVTGTLNQIVALRASGALPQNVNFAVKFDYITPTLRQALKGESLPQLAASPNSDLPKVIISRELSVALVIAR